MGEVSLQKSAVKSHVKQGNGNLLVETIPMLKLVPVLLFQMKIFHLLQSSFAEAGAFLMMCLCL